MNEKNLPWEGHRTNPVGLAKCWGFKKDVSPALPQASDRRKGTGCTYFRVKNRRMNWAKLWWVFDEMGLLSAP